MKKTSDQLIFPILVSALSVLNIARNLHDFHLTSVIVSLIGITAAVLFFLNKKGAPVLFYAWITLQLITFVSMDFSIVTNQLPEAFLGINFHNPTYLLSINFAPLFYLIGYRLLIAFNIIGKEVLLGPIKAGSPLQKSNGTITEYVNLDTDGRWYKITLENSDVVFIKPKEDGERLSTKKWIFTYVKRFDSERKKFQFIDWGRVKLK